VVRLVGRWRLVWAGRQLVSLWEWRRALRVSSSHGLVWWIEKGSLIRVYYVRPNEDFCSDFGKYMWHSFVLTTYSCIKGDMVVVQVNEADYLVGLEDCKTHLRGQIILSKEDKPHTHIDLTKICSQCGRLLDRGKQFLLGRVSMSLSSLF